MAELTAWLLDFGGGLQAAVGPRELIHLIDDPTFFDVPHTPEHCRQVLLWRERLLPVWDVAAWFGESKEANLVAVAAYQSRRREALQFGALRLGVPPERIRTEVAESAKLPAKAWRGVAISCFSYRGAAVPILDLRRMFSAASVPQGSGAEEDVLAASV